MVLARLDSANDDGHPANGRCAAAISGSANLTPDRRPLKFDRDALPSPATAVQPDHDGAVAGAIKSALNQPRTRSLPVPFPSNGEWNGANVGVTNWGVGGADRGVGGAERGVGDANRGVGLTDWRVGMSASGIGATDWGVDVTDGGSRREQAPSIITDDVLLPPSRRGDDARMITTFVATRGGQQQWRVIRRGRAAEATARET